MQKNKIRKVVKETGQKVVDAGQGQLFFPVRRRLKFPALGCVIPGSGCWLFSGLFWVVGGLLEFPRGGRRGQGPGGGARRGRSTDP
jgi:hypothetical protein